jgi:hypothetical protein
MVGLNDRNGGVESNFLNSLVLVVDFNKKLLVFYFFYTIMVEIILTENWEKVVNQFIEQLKSEDAFDNLIADDENFRNKPSGTSDQWRRED